MRLQHCLIPAFVLCLVAGASAPRAEVGLTVQFSEPGVYGRVDVARYPQPQVIVATPVIALPPATAPALPGEPIYLWVPPEHRVHWKEHCNEYRACGRPVYFVDHGWYQQHVLAQHQGEQRAHEDRDGGRDRDRARD